ncbi:MAG: APC family permease [Acidobacteriaceae bacterium]
MQEPNADPDAPVPTYDGPKLAAAETFGLRHNALSPLETLAQSVSTIAPSTSPQLTIPLVFVLAGQGTAIAYLIAIALMLLVGLCIAAFARESSSPGSLYVYTRRSLPPIFSTITALALFFAYITTASAVIGGFMQFAYVFLDPLQSRLHLPHIPAILLVTIAAAVAGFVAYHDVKVSARLMLVIEGASVTLIAIVTATLLLKHGLHSGGASSVIDHPQLNLRTMSPRGIGLGVMLAIFSFVGFESATTLGAEARNPLRTIPRAVIQSALLAGVFFILVTYGEVLGFRHSPISLADTANPFRYLSTQAGIPFLGPIIDIGVLISMFAATLACVIAASRVLLLMAHHGLAHQRLRHTNTTHETPGEASILAALLAFLPAAALALHHTTGADIYGWMGTLAVYGFLTAYGLVAVALAVHLHKTHRLTTPYILLTAAATAAMLAAMASNFYPIPPSPLRYFPYLYAAYLTASLLYLSRSTTRSPSPSAQD